jgi:hypothetical protein
VHWSCCHAVTRAVAEVVSAGAFVHGRYTGRRNLGQGCHLLNPAGEKRQGEHKWYCSLGAWGWCCVGGAGHLIVYRGR